MRALVLRMLVGFAGSALADPRPLNLTDVCKWFTIERIGDDLAFTCPGAATPWFTMKGCGPLARKQFDGLRTTKIKCAGWPLVTFVEKQ